MNRPKWSGRIATITGASLSLTSAAVSGSLSLDDCSRKGDIISISGSTLGGVLALTGTGVEYYVSKREEKLLEKEIKAKSEKKDLEKRKETDVLCKHSRDTRELRISWKNLKKICFEDLSSIQKAHAFSNEVDKSLKNLLKSCNDLAEKTKRDPNKVLDNLGKWLLNSNAKPSEGKLKADKKNFQDLEKIWQDCDISDRIDELKIRIDSLEHYTVIEVSK
ncbi:MAG: hypothetical protein MRERC_3c026 [Mycoplasmataceae bacterium RC_NB112A]|nr:MAG: hypothetical protein MRERC_3c026 [Mycoplasmataceae bacterium RC_NB112A]